ncbi:MAG TPA: hypothetical protein VJN89_10335 [Candidatus Acidoferrum sp.]|nr:hypothetical protein [Candidatus Acidoferrum sp.]
MDYERLSRQDLSKILRCNPPDTPHYQKALEEQKCRNRFWTLVISFAAVVLPVVTWLPFARSSTFLRQVEQESWRRLNKRNQEFENYKNDFRQFAQSSRARRSRNAEDTTDAQLMVVADQIVVHLEYTEAMAEIYLRVSAKKDRLAIWPLVAEQIGVTKKRLDQQMEVINALITELRTPAVVAEGTRMRDGLRGLEQDLDGMVNEIQSAEAALQ